MSKVRKGRTVVGIIGGPSDTTIGTTTLTAGFGHRCGVIVVSQQPAQR